MYNNNYVEKIIKCKIEQLKDEIFGRYLLKIKLNNNFLNTMTIVMMNSSQANELLSDKSVNKVIEFIYLQNTCEKSLVKNIGFINIVNIFPLYESNSGNVQEKINIIISEGQLDEMQRQNKYAFEDVFLNSEKVVFAWGDVPKKVSAKIHNHEVLMIYDLIVSYNLQKRFIYLNTMNTIVKVCVLQKRSDHVIRVETR